MVQCQAPSFSARRYGSRSSRALHVTCGITRSQVKQQHSQSQPPNWPARAVFASRIFAEASTSRDCRRCSHACPTAKDSAIDTARRLPRLDQTMGFWDTITDLVEAAAPWATADAEAPARESVCYASLSPLACCSLRCRRHLAIQPPHAPELAGILQT
jgi:hypothetical protein